MTEREIFDAALAITDPVARAAFLDDACRDDPALRNHIAGLLDAHLNLGSFLESPRSGVAVDAGAMMDQSTEGPGTKIGFFKLVEQIAEGGMGTVWMAEQKEPVKRLVALKLIKAGMDSRQVIARFEAERQALALMDHPNIARVLDGGTTSAGRPYFVMDLVRGVPITRYCDEYHLTPRQRLELFIPVCQAIQHAHQKGVIHRDLKPSNVLIALYDGKPVPKVIDFGVAKAVGQSLTELTLVTGFGNIVGTLEYMSPEQAEINQLDIDTRSDIYSLGVLLYELLTGGPPFSRNELEQAGMLEMLRVIREEEPSKPSTKLSTAEGLPTLAANRGTEPAKLTKLVRGELDWIVMKALEKDRNRRYDSANGFAMDVQRYLADEPVLACPPSVGYRLQKFVRRYKWPVSAAAVILLLLIGGIVGTSWGLVRAEQAKAGEMHQRRQAEEHFQLAVEAVDDYLTQVTNDPDLNKSDFSRLRKRLLESAVPFLKKLTEINSGNTLLESERGRAYGRLASLRGTMGEDQQAVADNEKAKTIFMKLTADFPREPRYRQDLAGLHNNQARQLKDLGKGLEAEKAYDAALIIQKKLVAEFPSELKYQRDLAATLVNLGMLQRVLNKRTEAEKNYRDALVIGEKLVAGSPTDASVRQNVAMAYNNLAILLGNRDWAEAEAAHRSALKIREKIVADFPHEPEFRKNLATSHNNLGALFHEQDKFEDAGSAYRAAQSIYETLAAEFPTLPEHRQNLARTQNNLGLVLADLEQNTEAEATYRAALSIREKLAADFPEVPDYQNELGATLTHLAGVVRKKATPANLEEAQQLLDRAFRYHEKALGAFPEYSVYRRSLRTSYRGLADLLIQKNDHVAGVKAADGLARHAFEPADVYDGARRISQCVSLAEADSGLDPEKRKALAESYALLAVQLLRQAMAVGYQDAGKMKEDPFLDILRQREDFKAVLLEMETKAKQSP